MVTKVIGSITSCIHCGKEFIKRGTTHKYCSVNCKESAKPHLYYKAKGAISKECPVCNKKFTTMHHHQKYCSTVCREKGSFKPRRTIGIVDCKNCGESFKQRTTSQKYCSEMCSKDFYSKQYEELRNSRVKTLKTTNCLNCGSTVVSEFHRKYCDDDCAKAFYKKKNKSKLTEDNLKNTVEKRVINILEKSKNTKPTESLGIIITEFTMCSFTEKIKSKVRERDNHRCQICEAENERLEVHHILKRTLGGSNDLDNLITLCVKCHRAIETNDKNHAIKVCYKNIRKVYGDSIGEKLTNAEKINILTSCLEDVFDGISDDKKFDEYETLLKIGSVLSLIDD